jgi:hypothetical protein
MCLASTPRVEDCRRAYFHQHVGFLGLHLHLRKRQLTLPAPHLPCLRVRTHTTHLSRQWLVPRFLHHPSKDA